MNANIGLRLAVLRLAAAHTEDRAWILGQLPEASRNHINALLADVADLGISDLGSWIDTLQQRLQATASADDITPAQHYWAGLLLGNARQGHCQLALADQLALEDRVAATGFSDDALPKCVPLPTALQQALRDAVLTRTQP